MSLARPCTAVASKTRSSLVLVLREKWDEPTKKTALEQFRFGFFGGATRLFLQDDNQISRNLEASFD